MRSTRIFQYAKQGHSLNTIIGLKLQKKKI